METKHVFDETPLLTDLYKSIDTLISKLSGLYPEVSRYKFKNQRYLESVAEYKSNMQELIRLAQVLYNIEICFNSKDSNLSELQRREKNLIISYRHKIGRVKDEYLSFNAI